jgi:hypothetical protein
MSQKTLILILSTIFIGLIIALFVLNHGLQQQLNDMNLEVEESNNEMVKTINSTNTQLNSLDTRIGKDVAMIEACYNTKYWVTIKDKTRYYFGTEKVTYRQAVDKCKDLCGKLFEPKDGSTFTKVFSHTPHATEDNYMWIGVLFSQSELVPSDYTDWSKKFKKR